MKISLHRGLSPKTADVAFASIDASGNLGPLNEFVLGELGYNSSVLKGASFRGKLKKSGFERVWEKGSTPLIFIVTTGGMTKRPMELGTNLTFAFEAYQKELSGKTLWIPLMGTGAAGLSFEESMQRTMEAIRSIPDALQPAEIQLDLPTTVDDATVRMLTELMDFSEDFDFAQALSEFKGSFYAVGSFWQGIGDQTERFIQEGIWELLEEESSSVIDDIRPGDLFLMKSTLTQTKVEAFRLKAIGVVTENPQNGRHLRVDWIWNVGTHDMEGSLAKFAHRIEPMQTEEFLLVADSLGRKRASWRNLFARSTEVQNTSAPAKRYWWWNGRMNNMDFKNAALKDEFTLGAGRASTSEDAAFSNVFQVRKGDSILAYQQDEWEAVVGLLDVTDLKGNDTEVLLVTRLTQRFEPVIQMEEIRSLSSMLNSTFTNAADVYFIELSPPQYEAIRQLRVVEQDEYALKPESKIANLARDTDDGEDYFGIQDDVEAFAKVIAARSFQPPLAIALFGKWGTGKSFFMNKLKARIKKYADDQDDVDNPTYCRGVAHIHFNAWSYLDANLWASLVTRIFEGLNEYIGKNTPTDAQKKAVEAELHKNLHVIKEERDAYASKKRFAEEQRDTLRTQQETSRDALKDEIDKVEKKTLKALLNKVRRDYKVDQKITEALAANPKFQELKSTLEEILPAAYRQNPELAIRELKSSRTFLREYMRDKELRRRLLLGVVVTLVILIVPALLPGLSKYLQSEFLWLPQMALSGLALALPIWKGYTKIYDMLKPIIADVWKVKNTFDQAVEEAHFSHDQEMAAIQLRIQQHTQDIEMSDAKIAELDKEVRELEFKLKHGLATETLYSFIEKRASSEDYKKHLGIISTIRNDFKILSDLFQESDREEAKNVKEFRARFTIPLQRIVLYVDDLDRCPENRVIEVLEAMNLLMAFPLFVVVVGVDPRWVKNALLQKYSLQFGAEKENGYESIDASDYLEKIFQVPFHLRQADDEDVKNMLIKLTEHSVEKKAVEAVTNTNEEGKKGESQTEKTEKTEIASVRMGETSVKAGNENLALLEVEVALMKDISPLLGNNPRAIKRFVNVYQIARAHEGLTIGDRKPESFFALMFLLALPIGPYRDLHEDFLSYLHKTEEKGAGYLGLYLTGQKPSGDQDVNEQRKRLNLLLDKFDTDKKIRRINSKDLARHNTFIQRFTFSEML